MRILFYLLILTPLQVTAQSDAGLYHWSMSDSSEHYVFGDTVFVRSAPSVGALVQDTLYAGDLVLVLKNSSNAMQLKGVNAFWATVSYEKGGKKKTGNVWTGLLSFTPMRRQATRFVFGFNRAFEKDSVIAGRKLKLRKYQVQLKVVEQGKVLATHGFLVNDDESLAFTQGSVRNGGGLTGVEQIVFLEFGGEACGIPAYTYPIAWDGKNLLPMPLLTDIGDADIFYHTEKLVLPADKGGLKDTIIVVIEEGESTEQVDKDNNLIYKIQSEKHYYSWDGNRFNLLKKLRN